MYSQFVRVKALTASTIQRQRLIRGFAPGGGE